MGRKRKELNEVRFCETCGTQITARTYYRKDGSVKGYYMPDRFCSLSCTGKSAHDTQFKRRSGKFLDKSGYVMLNPVGRTRKNSYQQPEHRAVMERMLGRKLEAHETVHHKNGIRHDNRPENLELWSGRHGRGQRATDLETDIWSGMIPGYQMNALVA
jgi:hypothetical protein